MRARVLIVDDDEVYLDGMKELLEESGYEVVLATTFEDGKRSIRDGALDLLIIDVRLGAFNGLQLISTGEVRIPAIVVTGFDDNVLRTDASGFGASYVVKPITPAALLTLIQQKLAESQREQGDNVNHRSLEQSPEFSAARSARESD